MINIELTEASQAQLIDNTADKLAQLMFAEMQAGATAKFPYGFSTRAQEAECFWDEVMRKIAGKVVEALLPAIDAEELRNLIAKEVTSGLNTAKP